MLPARRPYQDELLYSALLRCSRQFNLSLNCLGALLTGGTSLTPTFLGLGRTVQAAKLFRMSPGQLLWNHTHFPYSTRFLSLADRESALGATNNPCMGLATSRLATYTATGGLKYRRFCKTCAESEFTSLRESYWHRSHNLPCVWVCTKHLVHLFQSDVLIGASELRAARLPHECEGVPLGDDCAVYKALIAVAKFSTTWLNAGPRVGGPLEHGFYLRMAIANGWAVRACDYDSSGLRKLLSTTFPRDLLREADPRFRPEWSKWPVSVFDGILGGAFTPAKHAILHAFLSSGSTPELPFGA